MKTIFKKLAMMAIGVALFGLVACEKEKEEDTTYTESTSYGIVYEGNHIAAGETITIHPSRNEMENDFATIHLLLDNKTNANLTSVLKIEKVEGPATMNDIMICYGETCKNGSCPWVSDPFTLVPGINEDMLIKFDYTPSNVTEKTTYRMTIGKGASLEDPQAILINVNAQ